MDFSPLLKGCAQQTSANIHLALLVTTLLKAVPSSCPRLSPFLRLLLHEQLALTDHRLCMQPLCHFAWLKTSGKLH